MNTNICTKVHATCAKYLGAPTTSNRIRSIFYVYRYAVPLAYILTYDTRMICV